MTFQIETTIINEETGNSSRYLGSTFYQTKALAQYLATKESYEICKYGCGYADIVMSNTKVLTKQINDSHRAYEHYYGCPEHAMFGDEWFYGSDYKNL